MEILKDKGKVILLGNEAIVRGALESGVQFVATYPGTPASEIGDIFNNLKSQISNLKSKFYFEYSANEKVAMEAGIGASYSGLKTLIAMKNFGLNVCFDVLMPFLYTGCVGPTVIVVGDDPSCHSSAQSEQNSRGYSLLAHIPTLEPCDPQECKDFVKLGFKISEKFRVPVIIRATTRVAHQRAIVQISNFKFQISKKPAFVKDPERFVTMPPRVLEMKKELLQKIEKIRAFSEKSRINQITNYGLRITNFGIVTSGVSYLYVMEAFKELNLELPILKLGFFYPLPEEKIKKFIKPLKKVLIVEELEPWLEKEIQRLAKDVNYNLEISGKNLLPVTGELTPEIIAAAIAKLADKNYELRTVNYGLQTISHLPRFCDGCPYWQVFSAVKKAAANKKNIIFGGDIGCYMMASFAPFKLYDYLLCMGSSLGIAHGIQKSFEQNSKQKTIAFIGDSTFFHAGIPALINIVHNQSNPLIIILENRITAMTGHQPHPGIPFSNGKRAPEIKIENILKALEIKHWKVIDPQSNFNLLVKTIKQYLSKKELSVIVAKKICWLYSKRHPERR